MNRHAAEADPAPTEQGFAPGHYAFLDCGDGRRLERFGGVLTDRPAPAADFPRRAPEALWRAAALRYDGGAWIGGPPPDGWRVEWNGVVLGLRAAAGGQVGMFPEQIRAWQRLRAVRARRALALFGYTGASTLAAAAGGASEVVHVDASPTAVRWARENADRLGGGTGVPAASRESASVPRLRWLVEDAGRYVERARRRGKRFDAVALDPPTFGRGPRGETWQLSKDLPALLAGTAALLSEHARLLLVSAHTPGCRGRSLARLLAAALAAAGRDDGQIESEDWRLESTEGFNGLPVGAAAWWRRGRISPLPPVIPAKAEIQARGER